LSDWKPDPEFWKKISYKKEWKKHMDEVNKLKKKIIDRFPELESCIKLGLGADTDKWLKIPPDQKGDPDFEIYWNYKILCYIEVSGSDKMSMTPGKDIWIRPDKYRNAAGKIGKYWFWMVYRNGVYVLDLESLHPFKDNVVTKYIKTDPKTGAKVPEEFIPVPSEKASSEDHIFDWIGTQIKPK